jgi:hypothetical protein
LTDTTPDAIIPLSKKLEALITLRDGQVGLDRLKFCNLQYALEAGQKDPRRLGITNSGR